jgi:hypothetical protein
MVERAGVGHPDDVLAPQASGGLGLAHEPLDRLVAPDCVDEQEFEGNALVKHHVVRRVDHPHPAFADHTFDPVLAGDDIAGLGKDARPRTRAAFTSLAERRA